MKAPQRPISVDLFCGFGGTSEGHRRALGYGPDVAIDHSPQAIANHAANFPRTRHLQADIFAVTPRRVAGGRAVDILTASPDCGHYSRARGGKPCDSRIRDLGWVVVEWAQQVRPRHIIVENVPEYLSWGPLHPPDHPDATLRDRPIRERAGETWRAWVSALQLCGYRVEWKVLAACDYGAPTIRRRLFVQARCDGQAPAWPEPTHGPGRQAPCRTTAEIIDWTLPVPSIFERQRPLAEATQRRIAAGLRRYVFENPRPFLLTLTHGGRLHPLDVPVPTVTAAHRGELALVAPTLIQTGYGERDGQAPRVLDLHAPLGTVVAGGSEHALIAAWLTKFYGTSSRGAPVDGPAPTVTAGGGRGGGHVGLTAVWLAKHYGGVVGHGVEQPIGTVTARDHHALCAAFITKYYGEGSQAQGVDAPLDTIVTKARFGLVTVDLGGEPWVLTDLGMRMLQPHELAAVQGFGPEYRWTGSKADRIAGVGHSVAPDVIDAILRANGAQVAA